MFINAYAWSNEVVVEVKGVAICEYGKTVRNIRDFVLSIDNNIKPKKKFVTTFICNSNEDAEIIKQLLEEEFYINLVK